LMLIDRIDALPAEPDPTVPVVTPAERDTDALPAEPEPVSARRCQKISASATSRPSASSTL
jgi:hypothetical protein